MSLGGFGFVVKILVQLFGGREILHQFSNQLLLFSGGRTIIREQFPSLSDSDVPHVATDRVSFSALEIRAFQDHHIPAHFVKGPRKQVAQVVRKHL